MSINSKPTGITVLDKELQITWSDNHVSIYGHKYLRELCQCAQCTGETALGTGGLERQMNVRPPVLPGVKPTRLGEVGNYGININWSDGHHAGIYSFDYLRSICQCNSCEKKSGLE